MYARNYDDIGFGLVRQSYLSNLMSFLILLFSILKKCKNYVKKNYLNKKRSIKIQI